MKSTKFLLILLAALSQQGSGTVLKKDDYSRNNDQGLTIKTRLFTVKGSIFPNTTDVRFFGNIPYAEPPVGPLRFKAPVSVKKPYNNVINGTWFGPSCMQATGTPANPSLASTFQPGFLLSPGQQVSEDCLTLNIWIPEGAKKGNLNKLPVMIWIHGGGFTTNGAASPYKYGDRLARNQNVIVVSINYRLNIFGFSMSAALNGSELNAGLLDQRKAIEWVSANIHSFGGDAKRMTLFGQGQAVDLYSYAYPHNPLVSGLIAESGQATGATYDPDPSGNNFTYVAKQLGCNGTADAVFNCMQFKPATDILKTVAIGYAATANSSKPLQFSPVADNQIVFSNYTERQECGLFAKIPTIFSSANNEGGSTVPFTKEGPSGAEKVAMDAFTNLIGCGAASSALGRKKANVPVWRIRYFGEWPNLNPSGYDWLGAYHGSDLPMIFGTSNLTAPDTELETATSNYYQGAWAAFAKDPKNGLLQYGWPMYDPEKMTLIKLGNGTAGAVLDKGSAFDAACGRQKNTTNLSV
ncbi:alpha/beta-hydrolase [Periconia macrospinosa]|uniref:Alpha/beta-hydrolase n=1 Tax=Periconia macrospinosa TaxID=97972 RepID=A0A2V1EC92_9PLEO|nr:alpha/beta-hydrolase [Periconia macrospinosa]